MPMGVRRKYNVRKLTSVVSMYNPTGFSTSKNNSTIPCALILYSKIYCRGELNRLDDSLDDLAGFNDKAVSTRVEKNCLQFGRDGQLKTGTNYDSVTSLGALKRNLMFAEMLRKCY